jgi:hypothetical protein
MRHARRQCCVHSCCAELSRLVATWPTFVCTDWPSRVPQASDSAQAWGLTVQTENSGQIKSLDAGTCSGVSPPGCCAETTAGRKDAGAWWNVPPCTSGGSNQFALVGTHLVEPDTMLCAAATPSATPPPPPPSPPSPPGPPAPPAPGGPPILTQIQVETLHLNQPYSPMPFVAYPGQGEQPRPCVAQLPARMCIAAAPNVRL